MVPLTGALVLAQRPRLPAAHTACRHSLTGIDYSPCKLRTPYGVTASTEPYLTGTGLNR
uniref:Uncharacterized protein n=1 Tax=Arion vulgaris TaxID=1028688 RepID=A0A0B7BDX5_9EUPU